MGSHMDESLRLGWFRGAVWRSNASPFPPGQHLIEVHYTGQQACGPDRRLFARLSVIENSGADHRDKRLWRCLCLCGNEHVTTADDLREGRVKSCGCVRRDRKAAIPKGASA